MNDRNGNPIVVGDVYVVVGEVLSEFSTDKVALDTQRSLLVDDTVSGAAPTVAQVSTDLVPIASLGGSGHAAVTVTDSSSINLTLTGQDVTADAIFGTTSGTVCQGDDSRLSDARTPTAHVHSGADITSGTVATARLSMFGTGDPLGVTTAIASFAGLLHTHNGVDAPLLAQASTHQSPDTDSATSALHHTLGTGANQAAAGNHTHASTDIVSVTTDRLIGRDTAGTGAAEQLTVGGGVEFTGTGGIQRSALTGDVTASAGSASTTIANDAVSNAKMRNSAALSVIGRSANSTGDPADIAASADGNVLRRSGTTLGFGTIATAGIADDAVSNAKLRNSSALSVIGRSANSTGDPADIATAADGDVLRRSGTTLGFGTIVSASIGTVTTDRLLGRDTASTGTAEELTVGGNLEFTGSGGIQRGALTGAVTASAGSGTTAFGSFKANAILMNMTNASGVPTAVDGTDAAANMWAFLGGSYLLPAWRLSDAQLGSIAI